MPGVFLTGALNPKSNTKIDWVPGVKFTKKLNAGRVFLFNNCTDITLRANNGIVDGADLPGTTAFTHTISFLGAKRVTVEGLNVINASGGTGKDCYYLGLGTANAKCEDILLVGGSATYALRNNISVVGAVRTIIRNMEIAFATGAPGAGIDVEANFYGYVDGVLVDNCHIHSNANAGVLQVFGSNTRIKGGRIHDNGTYGVATASGGTQFDEAVYRPNIDIIAVTGSDNAAGVILVGDRTNLPVGMVLNIQLRNGATAPSEISTGYWVISRHVGTHGIVLGASIDFSEVTTFSAGFTGTLTSDPATSDVRIRAIADGQSDGFDIEGAEIYNNGTQGLFLAGSGSHYIYGCKIYDNGSNQVQISYTRSVTMLYNELYQTGASSNNNSGVSFATGSGILLIAHNNIHDIRGKAINGASWTDVDIDQNTIDNCGKYEDSSGKAGINLEALKGFKVTNNRVMQDLDNTTTLFGIYLSNTAINGLVSGNNCTNAGTTNANSIYSTSPSNTVTNNIQRDGTLRP